MGSIRLPHSSGNSMSLAAPATNPASNLELKLPATLGNPGEVIQNSTTAGTLEMGSPFRPAFSAYCSSNYTITNDTDVKAQFQSEHFDTDNAYDAVNDKFVVPANMGGAYQLNAGVGIDDIDEGQRVRIRIFVNDAEILGGYEQNAYSAGSNLITSVNISNVIELSAADEVKIIVRHNGDTNATGVPPYHYFSMFRLGGVAT